MNETTVRVSRHDGMSATHVYSGNSETGTIDGWSDDVELVCRNIEHNSVELSRLHKRQYLRLVGQQVFYRIPIIVLSSLNSIFSVGLSSYVEQDIVSVINCLISLLCGIISSVELYFQLTKRIETALITYREFYLLSTRINSCLKLERDHRHVTSGVDFLTDVMNKYNTLFEGANVMSDDYTDELQLRRIVYTSSSRDIGILEPAVRSPINNVSIH